MSAKNRKILRKLKREEAKNKMISELKKMTLEVTGMKIKLLIPSKEELERFNKEKK